MPGPSCSLDLSEMVLTEHTNPKETENSWKQAHKKIHPVLVFCKTQYRWNHNHTQKVWNCLVQKREWSSNPGSAGKWVSVDTLPMNQSLMYNQETKYTVYQIQVNTSTWYFYHHTGITKLHTDHRLRVDHVTRENKTGKGRPHPNHVGNWRHQVTLCWVPKAVYPCLEDHWVAWGFSLLKAVEVGTTQCIPTMAIDDHP